MNRRPLGEVAGHAAVALGQGGSVKSQGVITWDLKGGCEAPLTASLEGRRIEGKAFQLSYERPDHAPIWMDYEVRCRKCSWCLRQRAALWAQRAKAETHAASRTWFGTLTLRPEEHFLAACRAEAKRGGKIDPAEDFGSRHAEIGPELTRWLKRVRKSSGARLRYLLVAEKHKSGLPHYHVLIHERWLSNPVTERTLRLQWLLGHSKFNLITDQKPVWYVCKYLSKSAEARVRASQRYGESTA